MAEIFAWSPDFYRDPREGDEFCMLVEKKEYTDGQPLTYRRILAAKFYSRVSSHFSHRWLHPVLKTHRPHYGTDYAAPVGTPVHTLAAGRVFFSGRSGGGGNVVKIKHADGFETQYRHLSRRLVQSGQRVEQGQWIGLVGAAGLATGPHLDLRVRKAGKFVNFRRPTLPSVSRISAEQSETFL